jgi:alpha-galactosidase
MSESNRMVLANETLGLELDRDQCSVSIRRVDGSIAFGPLIARVHLVTASGKAFNLHTSLVEGFDFEEREVETPLGPLPGLVATLGRLPGIDARLRWEWALAGAEDALARVSLENNTGEKMTLKSLSPAAYRGADPGLDMGAGYLAWRFYELGYQSWSPAGSMGVMDRAPKPSFPLPKRMGTNPRTADNHQPGIKASDWMAQVVEAKLGLSCLLGFVTTERFHGRVEFEVKYDRFRRLEALLDGEGAQIDAGEEVNGEWCLVSLSRDPLAQQERYFERWGQAMKARTAKPLSGWRSWRFAFTGVSEKTIDSNLTRLAALEPRPEVVQIDEGYEPWVGEWNRFNEKFPSPPAQLAGRIRDQGFRPGIWLAPFLCSRESAIYHAHPEWMLRGALGLPILAMIHPAGKGRLMYALDATHPQYRKWLREQVRVLVHTHGFTYLKLDFLYAAALPGERWDAHTTGAQALRQGLADIREAAGDDAYIMGCGCPLGPAVGIVDAMRVSPDIDIKWRKPLIDLFTGAPFGPGAKNCLRNNLARLAMGNRLWAPDPDCIVLRREKGGLTEAEIQSQLTVQYLSGGAAFLSEDLTGVGPERLAWFGRLLPPSGKAARAVDLFERGFPSTAIIKRDDSALVALFNWRDEPRELEADLPRFGLTGPWHAFDGWTERYLGALSGLASAGVCPSHGVRYLRLTRADGKPRLLAHNLHLGLGDYGTTVESADGGLKVTIELPGKRQGLVWAVFPGGRIEARKLEFEGQGEVLIKAE